MNLFQTCLKTDCNKIIREISSFFSKKSLWFLTKMGYVSNFFFFAIQILNYIYTLEFKCHFRIKMLFPLRCSAIEVKIYWCVYDWGRHSMNLTILIDLNYIKNLFWYHYYYADINQRLEYVRNPIIGHFSQMFFKVVCLNDYELFGILKERDSFCNLF